MDPQTTLRDMLHACADGDRGEAYAALKELYIHVGNGGALPDVVELTRVRLTVADRTAFHV
jgi:hypothetical protein